MTPDPVLYPQHRFPAAFISYAVWLYHVFSLSLRDVELILAERGIVVTHESIRHWCLKLGADFARRLRHRNPRPGDTWHLDEVFVHIRGMLDYLWRAVDQNGGVLDILMQERRNGAAAKRFFKHLLHGIQYKPLRLVTDGLRSYGVAQQAVLPDVRRQTSRYLNNRAENSHRPTRRRDLDRWIGQERGHQIPPVATAVFASGLHNLRMSGAEIAAARPAPARIRTDGRLCCSLGLQLPAFCSHGRHSFAPNRQPVTMMKKMEPEA